MTKREKTILLLPWQLSRGKYTSGSYIRLIEPFRALAAVDDSVHIAIGDNYEGGDFDAVVIERSFKEEVTFQELYELAHKIRQNSALVIYEIDDDLFSLYGSDSQDTQRLELLSAVCWLTRNADAVICSTEELAGIIRTYYNPTTFVFPNYLSQRYLQDLGAEGLRLKDQEQIEIGYMGTLSHLQDLGMVSNALKEILCEYKQASMHVVQIAEAEKLRTLMKPYRIEVHSPPTYEYEGFFSWFTKRFRWDIGIAPLEDTPLNRSKSDLKLLDLAAIGAAGIFSDIVPYREIESLGLGMVVKNTDECWYNGLKKIIEDQELRKKIQRAAVRFLHKHRVLENNIHMLRELLDGIFKICL